MARMTRRRARRSGFTLLEILIVVGIIALLAAFVVPNLMGASNKARIDLAKSAVDSSNGPIATALNLFKLAMGTYPKELKELSERPDSDEQKRWAGPYIDPTKLKDPWDEEYQYRFPSSTQGEDKFDLWSKGPDKQDGTDGPRGGGRYLSAGIRYQAYRYRHDTMQFIKPDVATYCIGQAASVAAVLLASGAKGKRYSLPNSRILIHQPWVQGLGGQTTDIDIHARELLRTRERLNQILAQHTGQPLKRIQDDTERDYIMGPDQGKEYGIIDDVIRKRA